MLSQRPVPDGELDGVEAAGGDRLQRPLLVLVPDEDVEPDVPLVQRVGPAQGVLHRVAPSSASASASCLGERVVDVPLGDGGGLGVAAATELGLVVLDREPAVVARAHDLLHQRREVDQAALAHLVEPAGHLRRHQLRVRRRAVGLVLVDVLRVLEVEAGAAVVVVTEHLDRVDAGDRVLRGVAEEVDVLGIGVAEERVELLAGADRAPELEVARRLHAVLERQLPDPVPQVGDDLDGVVGDRLGLVVGRRRHDDEVLDAGQPLAHAQGVRAVGDDPVVRLADVRRRVLRRRRDRRRRSR